MPYNNSDIIISIMIYNNNIIKIICYVIVIIIE